LGYEGILRLPSYLPKVFVIDNPRREAISKAKKYLDSGQNVLLVGEPGTGKTALMFIILAELKKAMEIAYILEGVTSIGRKHEEEGIILFYDDIPRMNRDALRSIMKNRVRMILATARKEELEFLKRVTGIDLLKEFRAIEVPPMSKEKLREMLLRYVAEEAIRIADKEAVDEVIEKAGGLPVYIWQVIRELRIRREPLTLEFAKTIPQGMLDYIDDILWRTLGGQPERYEALIALLCMTDFIKYAVHQDLYNYIYLRAKELRTKRRVTLDEIMLDETLEAISRYLARESATYSFRLPHDSWADVLRGKSKGPMASEISKINMVFPRKKRISIVLEAARRAWSESLEETEDIFRRDAFKNNIILNLGKEAWNDIQKGITTITPPTPITPAKPELAKPPTPRPMDPLKVLKQEIANMGVASKRMLAQKVGVSEAELESLIDLADFIVESKRPGFAYYKDHYIVAMKKARDILSKHGKISLEELAKRVMAYPEDLQEKIGDIAIIHDGTAYHRENITKTIVARAKQRGYIATREIRQMIPDEVFEEIRREIEKELIASPTRQKYYSREYLENEAPKLIGEMLRRNRMMTKEEIVKELDIPRNYVDKYLEQVAEKSPTTQYYYPKGTIQRAKQQIVKLIEKAPPTEYISRILGIVKQDIEKILRDSELEQEYIQKRIKVLLELALEKPGLLTWEKLEELKELVRKARKYEWDSKQLNNLGVAHLIIWEKTHGKQHYRRGIELLKRSGTEYAKYNLEIAQAKAKLGRWFT